MILFKILIALLLTIIIELSIAIILKINNKQDLINIIIINCITNLSLNIFVIVTYFNKIKINILILELIIVFIEGLFYQKKIQYKRINPYFLSLLLNTISYTIGLLINI